MRFILIKSDPTSLATKERKPGMVLPLELLRAGERAEIADVLGEPGWVTRMAELGLRVGSHLQMLRSGSPCLLEVGNSRLSLRGDHRLQILVRPLARVA